MPRAATQHFGLIPYDENAVLVFPHGLPGFEDRCRFLPLTLPGRDPLVFLQSLEDPALCFITLPVLVVEPSYRLEVSREDRALLDLPPFSPPRIGEDVLCLAVISVRPGGATANLLAPIVVNLRNSRAVQAVSPSLAYSHQHALPAAQEASPCS